ncbi:rRNA maturation RNase YbeY [Amylibacter marinus]|nr:rRNA maturation RNase YbeY [Amylibacter marinus]
MTNSVEVILEDSRWAQSELDTLALGAFDIVLRDIGLAGGWHVNVLACDDAKIQQLNADHRRKDAATNVLSWPNEELAPEAPGGVPDLPTVNVFGENELGDIAVSFETCRKEAQAKGISMRDHVTHLLIHGYLHLLGYDHETDADATLMEGKEILLLETLGISDPYREDKP